MIAVIHYETSIDPDVYFGLDEKTERKIINGLKSNWIVSRSTDEEWFGQNDPKYAIHHWNATKKAKQ